MHCWLPEGRRGSEWERGPCQENREGELRRGYLVKAKELKCGRCEAQVRSLSRILGLFSRSVFFIGIIYLAGFHSVSWNAYHSTEQLLIREFLGSFILDYFLSMPLLENTGGKERKIFDGFLKETIPNSPFIILKSAHVFQGLP